MFNERKFRAQLVLVGLTMKTLAEEMGIDESTLYRKVSSGGNFTRKEINTMIPILQIDTPMDIFFDQELAETQDKR